MWSSISLPVIFVQYIEWIVAYPWPHMYHITTKIIETSKQMFLVFGKYGIKVGV